MFSRLKEEMNEEKIKNSVETAMDAETFEVLAYVEDQPVAQDNVTIYTNVPNARKLQKLVEERGTILAKRRANEHKEDYSDLSIADNDEDTELDDEINELIEELEKTALTFHTKTVAPKLIKAIERAAVAKADKAWSAEEAQAHSRKTTADILARAIDYVERGDGAKDTTPWTADRLMALEDSLYDTQAEQLVGALYEIVNTGTVFDEALTVDF